MAKTATKTETETTTEAPEVAVDLTAIPGLADMSPMEQIQALSGALKNLKSNASEAMAADAKAKFEPLHGQMTDAFAAVVDGDNPERAALALKWIGENITEYRRIGRQYHKAVFGVAAPRAPRKPASDDAAAE